MRVRAFVAAVAVAALGVSAAGAAATVKKATPQAGGTLVGLAYVDALGIVPEQTLVLLENGATYVLEAVGRFKYMGEMGWPATNYADAECSTHAFGAPKVNAYNTLLPGFANEDPLDVYVNGSKISWTPAVGTADPFVPACSTTSQYTHTLVGDGSLLRLRIFDFFPAMYLDNGFGVVVTVWKQ